MPTAGLQPSDRVELTLNGAPFAPSKIKLLDPNDISKKFVDFEVSGEDLGNDGGKNISAIIYDRAGNSSASSNGISFKLKKQTPGIATW